VTNPISPALRLAVNVVTFQLGWFACVIAAGKGQDAIGIVAALAVIAVHLILSTPRSTEIRVIALAVAFGAVWDSLLRAAGLMHYLSAGPTFLAPAWILSMWGLFGTTLNVSLRWLRGRPVLALLFGAIGGPMSFWAGQRLGAVQITGPWAGLLAQAAGWAVILPLLLHLAARLERMGSGTREVVDHV
jgi:hypothetical protein